MQKILELKPEDFIKGLSVQTDLPMGGIFKSAPNFDPFNKMGVFKASVVPGSVSVGTAPYFLNSVAISGTEYMYAHSDTKLYRVLTTSPYTVTDVTSEITVGTDNHTAGAIVWKGAYCYITGDSGAPGTTAKKNAIPVASASDANLYASGGFNASMTKRKIYVGPDDRLYITDQLYIQVVPTLGGAMSQALALGGSGGIFTSRDITDDGRYLIIVADDNNYEPTARVAGNYNVKIYFWDLFNLRSTADVIWTIKDSYVVGCKYLDGVTYIFTSSGIYICSLTTSPKLLISFSGSTTLTNHPTLPQQILNYANQIYFAEGQVNASIARYFNAYGNKFSGKKIFSQPQVLSLASASNFITCASFTQDKLVVATDEPKIYFFNDGGADGNATLTTVPTSLGTPFTFDYAKVVLKTALTTGQSITFALYTASGETICAETTKTYAMGAKKTFVFPMKPTTGSVTKFEDCYVYIAATGCEVKNVRVYGTPKDDNSQEI